MATMRALVIEDEAKRAAYLRQGLSENGFIVEVCTNGEDGLHEALSVESDTLALRYGRFANRNSGNR